CSVLPLVIARPLTSVIGILTLRVGPEPGLLSTLIVLPTLLFFALTLIVARDSYFFFFSSRRRHTRFKCDWSSDVCSSDLAAVGERGAGDAEARGHGAVRGASVQDDFRAACGRRDVFPSVLGDRQERAGRLQRAARGGRKAEPPLRDGGEGSDRNPRAARGGHRRRGQTARHAH